MSVTYLLLYGVIALLTAILYLLRRNLNYWKDRGIPYIQPHPLYGNLNKLGKTKNIHQCIDDVYKKLKGTGPIGGLYFFHQPMALIMDRKLAKNILIKDFANFADRTVFYNERDDPLTAHLLTLDGAKWRNLRHKLSPTFTSGKMKFMFPTVVSVAEKFVKVLDEILPDGNVIEIKELLARFTTDVIGTCAFGIECNSLKDPDAEFRVMGRSFLQKQRHGKLLTAFIRSFPNLARKLRMRLIPDDIHDFFMRVVRETVTYREENNIKRNDFMDLLIELKNKRPVTLDNGEVVTGLSIEQIAAQAFVFFLAGFETSSTAMGFALYELAQHQDIQDKVRKEINEVLAKHNNQITYEYMGELTYMDQVISETLRRYTVVAVLNRRALNDYPVPGSSKLVIEKGTSIAIPANSYHLDEDIYPDPYAFKPERFSPEEVAKRDSVDWLPFGEGPRNCIGLRFGKMQSRIGLTFLLKNFKFSVCDQTQIPLKYNTNTIILNSEGGIFLRVDKI